MDTGAVMIQVVGTSIIYFIKLYSIMNHHSHDCVILLILDYLEKGRIR